MFSSIGTLIWTLIIGIIVGALARLLLPGKEAFPPGALGWLLTAVLGIVGAFIGTFVGRSLGFGSAEGEMYAAGWIMSIAGAIVVLLLVRLLMGNRNAT